MSLGSLVTAPRESGAVWHFSLFTSHPPSASGLQLSLVIPPQTGNSSLVSRSPGQSPEPGGEARKSIPSFLRGIFEIKQATVVQPWSGMSLNAKHEGRLWAVKQIFSKELNPYWNEQ